MKLSELVDELRNNILNDRSDSFDGDPDQLWDDATLVRYINEAVRRFATRGFVIKDASTPEVVNVTLVEGVETYTLHPSVIAVVSAKLSDAANDLARTGHSILNEYRPPDRMWDAARLQSMSPGSTIAYSTDEEIGLDDDDTYTAVVLRVYPVPDADAAGSVIKLRVFRKPLDELKSNNMSVVPEIPLDHHIEALDWAAYLALRIVDTDAGNNKRAAEFANSFESHVQEARKMVLRKLHAPVGWGFGRNGWSWES